MCAVGSAGFDDLPSTTVVERSPAAAPAFKRSIDDSGPVLTLRTDWLTLHYRRGEALLPASGAGCDVMNVTVHSTGAVWCLAMGVAAPSQQNLNGSLETTDCYVGWRHCLAVYDGKMQPGVISRSGYAVINDTSAVLFDRTNENFSWPSGWRRPRSHAPGESLCFFPYEFQVHSQTCPNAIAVCMRVTCARICLDVSRQLRRPAIFWARTSI